KNYTQCTPRLPIGGLAHWGIIADIERYTLPGAAAGPRLHWAVAALPFHGKLAFNHNLALGNLRARPERSWSSQGALRLRQTFRALVYWGIHTLVQPTLGA